MPGLAFRRESVYEYLFDPYHNCMFDMSKSCYTEPFELYINNNILVVCFENVKMFFPKRVFQTFRNIVCSDQAEGP